MTVIDGQTVKVHLEWQEAQDLIAKERETQLKLIDQTQNKVVNLEKEKSRTAEKLEITQRNAAKLANELMNIKNGWSFRIGRVITFIPRKMRDWLK